MNNSRVHIFPTARIVGLFFASSLLWSGSAAAQSGRVRTNDGSTAFPVTDGIQDNLIPQGHPPIQSGHGGRAQTPNIVELRPGGPLRVDTKDGPVYIRQCEGLETLPQFDGVHGRGVLEDDPCVQPEGGLYGVALGNPPSSPGGGRKRTGHSPGTWPGSGGSMAASLGPGFSGWSTPAVPAITPAGLYPKCLLCHWGIEDAFAEMGPWGLDCTFCHGGDPNAHTKSTAHVPSNGTVTYDQATPSLTQDLAYQRFVNPSNLRVVDQSCGVCHPTIMQDVKKGLMATNAGHVTGGLYLNGVQGTKDAIYGNFAISDTDGQVPTSEGAVASLLDLIDFDPNLDPSLASTHYRSVPSQACARCHLWSRGKGYRGALGMDGVYRADGCAACHILYGDDGLSGSTDWTIDHTEPGHGLFHTLTKSIPSQQCIHCHHRGARIGLNFTGRAQMPPRLPSGPGVPGTTDVIFNENYHYTVADTNPPDVHHAAGMHCIDCHVSAGVMGDGNIYSHMDQATMIECQSCHGTPYAPASLADNDGGVLNNITQDPGTGDVTLTSKVTGAEHDVSQVEDIINPLSSNYNALAAAAMNDVHLKPEGGLECYACHTGWVPNCYGCHFERDETQMGQNLITGQWQVGKANTGNKIYESLRAFSLGPNSSGRVAPYVVSCMPIADVTDASGTTILDFVMPTTQNGLSGLGHNPVQPHTVRGQGEVRSCVECHRSPPTLGFGSGNYTIARGRITAGGGSGLEHYDKESDPVNPASTGTQPGVASARGIARLANVVEGTTDYLYVAQGLGGVDIFDGTTGNIVGPVGNIGGVNAGDVARAARYLYVVDIGVGIKIYDNDTPTGATLVSQVGIPAAMRVFPWGIHLFVASGTDGVHIVDIGDHNDPRLVGQVGSINAVDIEFYAHFQAGSDFEVRAYVADPDDGVWVLDLLPDFETPTVTTLLQVPGASGLDAYTRYVPATSVDESREHDYLYVVAEGNGLHVFDMTLPDNIVQVAALPNLGTSPTDVVITSEPGPPGVDDIAYVADFQDGIHVLDVNDPTQPVYLGTSPSAINPTRILVEGQQLDRYLDEQGNTLKENSHPFITTFDRAAIVRILRATIP